MTEKNEFFPWKVQQFITTFVQDITNEHQSREQKQATGLRPSENKLPPPKNVKPGSMPKPVAETKTAVVEVPKEVIDQFTVNPGHAEEDWEFLSEKASNRSIGGEAIVVRAGSVRSIDHDNSSNTTLSLPFKIQRTVSSSTLDSQDNVLGPSGKGVLGVDYVEHIVLPTDTLQGVCLAYKVSASNLRRANHFSGNSLHSAPKKLLIPLSKQALRTGFIRVQDTDTKEYKLSYFQAEYPDINGTEARA
jgi:LysM repeat protein